MHGAAALITAAVTWLSFTPADAQGFMRLQSFNVGSRTPNFMPRVNPGIAGRAVPNTAAIARRGADAGNAPIVRRGTIVNTAASKTSAKVARTAGRTKAVAAAAVTRPRIPPRIGAITPGVAVVLPTIPYVRYRPNLYPACAYAYRGAGDGCSGQPSSPVDLGGIGGSGGPSGPPPRSQDAGGPRRNAARAAVNLRYLGDQIIAEIEPSQADALARRHRLRHIGSQDLRLLGSSLSLFRITDRRSAEQVRTELAAAGVRSQLNFRYVLQDQKSAPAEGDPAQYALAKLRLPEAHALSRGANVTVAVIDSGIDVAHPELAHAIAESFDALGAKEGPHVHGTGIAGAIVSHGRLMGSAPKARILAIRAFGAAPNGAESTSFVILKSLDFAASHGAQIVNMSFAGPKDPLLERGIAAAATKGMVLVAASGNAGPKSPPLYPAANPDVIAVSATDAHDRLFPASNRGGHIAVAAPGVDIFLPAPDGKYQMTSGTSFSAAYISGLAALMMARKPELVPAEVRAILMKTARDLGLPGRDDLFGAGEADAFSAVTAVLDTAPVAAAPDPPAAENVEESSAIPATRDLAPATAALAEEKPAEK
jgi:hypothetical protein